MLASFVGAADLAEAQVTIPNTFSDGTPALASEVNQNFQTLASAVNASDCATPADVVCNPASVSCPACPQCPAALPCDTAASYVQGISDGQSGVDITSDNAAVCTTAGGTYDVVANSCSVEADIAAAGSAACTQAGGAWNAGTSTCIAAYNCWVGGYCSRLAVTFPPADNGYINVYEGHTTTTEPAYGGGCGLSPGAEQWQDA